MDEQRESERRGGPMHGPQAAPEQGEPFEPAAGTERLARDLVALRTVAPDASIGAAILRRLDTSGAPGLHAAGLGGRFAPRAMRAAPLPMTVSPYAPPQRQISVVRQGAPMWRSAEAPPPAPEQAPAPRPAGAPAPKVAPQDANEIPPDLKALLAMHRARGTI